MEDPVQADEAHDGEVEARRALDSALLRALATPPISNEDILKRSKESHRK